MSSLSHHGIKGQKWGVRRYQNKDGTRTAAGKKQEKLKRLKKTSKDYASIKESLSDDDLKFLNYDDDDIKRARELGTLGRDLVDSGRVAHRVIQKDKNGTPVTYVDANWMLTTSLLTGKNTTKLISIDLATRSGEEYRGKGYAVAAGKKMVKWFDTYGYKDYEYMEWGAKEKNIASQKTAEKLGFKKYEGTTAPGWTIYTYEHKAQHTSIGGTMYIEGNALILGDSSYLEHHGIRGQRWGVRRFQNKDGTRTAAGKRRNFEKETLRVINKLSNEPKPIKRRPFDKDKVRQRGLLTKVEADQCAELAAGLYKNAEQVEPKITGDVIRVVSSTSAKMYGLEHRLKQPTSIAAKIGSDAKGDGVSFEEAASGIKDTIRYTAVSDSRDYVDTYNAIKQRLRDNGYEETKCKNYFQKYQNGEVLHKAVQSTFKSPDGIDFEFQFQTPESQAAKELKLPIYNERRKAGNTPERNAHLEQEMRNLAELVPDPEGVFSIQSHSGVKNIKHTSIGGTMYIEGNALILGDSSYLEHHGIRGQRWGVRRFQNRDGSLTNAGRKRLGYATKGVTQTVGKAFKAGVKACGNAVKAVKAHHEKKEAEKLEKKKEKASKTRLGVMANKDLFTNEEIRKLNERFKLEDEMKMATLQKGVEIAKAVGTIAQNVGTMAKAYEDVTGQSLSPIKRKAAEEKAKQDAEDRKRKLAKEDAETKRAEDKEKRDIEDRERRIKLEDEDRVRKQAKEDADAQRAENAEKRAQAKEQRDSSMAVELQRKAKAAADEQEHKAVKAKAESRSAILGVLDKIDKIQDHDDDDHNNPPGGGIDTWDDDDYLNFFKKTGIIHSDISDPSIIQNGVLFIDSSDSLAHHGVKGQRWGVRRFQNADGSLTEKGRKHYEKALAKEKRKQASSDAIRGTLERQHPFAVTGAAVLGAVAAGMSIAATGGASAAAIAAGSAISAAVSAGLTHVSYSASEAWEGRGTRIRSKKIAKYEDILKQSDGENGMYHVENGTLFINAGEPHLEHHGVKGMKWGKHLMAGKGEAGAGGGSGEDDEKLKEMAKKAGMSVAEYRNKFVSKIGSTAGKVGEKISVKDKHLVINGSRSGSRGLAVGETGEKPKSFKEKAYDALGGKYKTQAADAHREMVQKRNDADDKARRANAQGRAANANKKAGNVREYMANKEGARQLDAEAKGARMSQWEATKKANSAQWKYDHSLAGLYDKATGKYKQAHKKTAIPKMMDRWKYEYTDGPNSKLFNNGKGKAKTAKEQAKAEVWTAADHQIKAKEYNDVANSQGGNASYYGQAYKNAAEREARLSEGSYRRAAALGKQASNETSTSSRPRARKKKHTSGGSGVTVRRPGRKPVSRTKRVTQSSTGVKRRSATGTGARVRRGA